MVSVIVLIHVIVWHPYITLKSWCFQPVSHKVTFFFDKAISLERNYLGISLFLTHYSADTTGDWKNVFILSPQIKLV
ncbi:hypothetical protein, partial [Phocaeicola plebeius]|uniref:hypothetical protein n=1 Tax=Phocaeicola plebeius TaxID=310297 RepID=UPI0029438E82